MILSLFAYGCLSSPVEREEPAEPPPIVVPTPTAAPKPRASSTGPVDVDLQYLGVGPLHQGFFGEEALVSELGQALGECLTGTATVRISWDSEEKLGRIRLAIPPEQLMCVPEGHNPLELQPLTPLSVALAKYRERVAQRFDFRIASFRVGLQLGTGESACTLEAKGQHPPNGTTFDPCVRLGIRKVCLAETEATTRFGFPKAPDTAALAACLQ